MPTMCWFCSFRVWEHRSDSGAFPTRWIHHLWRRQDFTPETVAVVPSKKFLSRVSSNIWGARGEAWLPCGALMGAGLWRQSRDFASWGYHHCPEVQCVSKQHGMVCGPCWEKVPCLTRRQNPFMWVVDSCWVSRNSARFFSLYGHGCLFYSCLAWCPHGVITTTQLNN